MPPSTAAYNRVVEERDILSGTVVRLEAELTSALTNYEAVQRHRAEEDAVQVLLQAQIRTFNTILEKIVRVSKGQSVVENRNENWTMTGTSHFMDSTEDKLSFKERQAQQVASLSADNRLIESRLAAVRAIAEFAKDHKA